MANGDGDPAPQKQKSKSSIRRRFVAAVRRVIGITSNEKKTSSETTSPPERLQEPVQLKQTDEPPSSSSPPPPPPAAPLPQQQQQPSPPRTPPFRPPSPQRAATATTAVQTTPLRSHPTRKTLPDMHSLSPAANAYSLFKKYGLEINVNDWEFPVTPPLVDRVHKNIRMTVHRTCHICNKNFGSEKVCEKCHHHRCKKCPRRPVKKRKHMPPEFPEAHPLQGKRYGDLTVGLRRPTRQGPLELVYKPVLQRVRRECHCCHLNFAGEKICTRCGHQCCKLCPRFPKNHKSEDHHFSHCGPRERKPDFHAPNLVYKRPRQRVYWVCKLCTSTFIEHSKICEVCGSHREHSGERHPPPKNK